MRRLFLVPLLLLPLGCKVSPRQRIVGNWMADQTRSQIPKTPFIQYEGQFKRLLASARVKFSANGTAVFTGPIPVEGKWTYEDHKVRLVPNDRQLLERIPFVDTDIVFEVDKDFENLTWKLDTVFGPVLMVLRKTG